MALRQIIAPWDAQPPAEVGPVGGESITDGLAFLWTAFDAPFDRVRGAFATTRNATQVYNRFGSGIQCSTGQANLEWARPFITTSDGAGTGDFTMLVLAAPTVGGGASQHVFAQKNDAAGSPFAQVAILANANNAGAYSSGSLSFLTFNSASSGVAFAGGIDGNPHVFAAVRIAGGHVLYIDGVQVAASTLTVRNILQSAARYTAVGSRGNGTTDAMSGPATFAAAWNRGLSADEIRELGRSENLWRLFEPQRIWVPVGAGGGGDVSVALSGQGATASAGTLGLSSAIALSGAAANASAGTVTPSVSVGLSGSAVTSFAGTLTYTLSGDLSIALSGQAIAATAGTLAPSTAKAIAGEAAAASAGTLTAAKSFALSGVAVAASAGTVVPSSTVALSGESSTAAAGTITYVGDGDVVVALSGQAVTTYAGTLTIAPSFTSAGVLYIPIRMVSALWSASGVGGGDGQIAWLPPQRHPIGYVYIEGRRVAVEVDSQYYRMLDYVLEQKLGGRTGPTLPAVVEAVTTVQTVSAAAASTVTELQQQASANAESLYVVRRVAKLNLLDGSDQIPEVEL